MFKRGSGLLTHITSLPSKFGIGDLGPDAYKFVDFLKQTKQTFWQVLPLNPTSYISGNSPYASFSAYAGNILLISPELMLEMNLLIKEDLDSYPNLPQDYVDFSSVIQYKLVLFKKAFIKFKKNKDLKNDFDNFINDNQSWLYDFASFMAYKSHFQQKPWNKWPEEIRDRNPDALKILDTELENEIFYYKFTQFLFYKQLRELKDYCDLNCIKIIGDIPYYVNYDSADVWTNSHLFKLNHDKKPSFVAGVPPDYFSETGQLWGNPVYDWEVLKENNFDWWIQRIQLNLRLYHIVRIDHFRGFLAYWEVPATESTAINGNWIEAPAHEFFTKLNQQFPDLPIIAEDLGVITQDVKDFIQKFDLPGMRILLFAFDENLPFNDYAPHNHIKNCLVYTGTHDNNTIRGWFEEEINENTKKRISDYIGHTVSSENIHWDFIRMAFLSVANTVIIPIQDLFGLGSEHRMNRPATLNGNWQWRLKEDYLTSEVKEKLLNLTFLSGRG
jgi:4-alpha-glucanotransferase